METQNQKNTLTMSTSHVRETKKTQHKCLVVGVNTRCLSNVK